MIMRTSCLLFPSSLINIATLTLTRTVTTTITTALSLCAQPATVLLLLLLTFTSQATAFTYKGCYKDVMPVRAQAQAHQRDLNAILLLEEGLTLNFCEQQCGKRGYRYFGAQFGQECWCDNTFGRYGTIEESRCYKVCGGDRTQICGGDLVNSVYSVEDSLVSTPPPRTGRPLLGLVMIVKDEAHTLPSTLVSIKPYLDYYHILDTGSTDGTQDAIRKVLGENGEIWEEPFIDYGRSRNRALEIAQQSKNAPVFSLMLSADETMYNAFALRQFCEQHRDSYGDAHEAYPIQMDVGWRFDSLRLSRTDKGWRYVGRVHEYLAAPDQKWHPTMRVPDAYIKFRVTDPERRSNREYTILRILQEEKAEKPTDTRTSFYLARTYNVIGNHSAALDEFRRRVALGGWQEEVYESLYAIAWQLESLNRPWFEIQQAFLDAYDHSPERAEPLYAVASHYYQQQKYASAFMFANHAISLPYPKQAVLWVQQAVYDWQCLFVVGMTAQHMGKSRYELGYRSLKVALERKGADSVMQKQLEKYRELLGPSEINRIDAELSGKLLTISGSESAGVPAQLDAMAVNNREVGLNQETYSTYSDSSAFGLSGWLWLLAAVVFVLAIGLALGFMALNRGKVFRGADGVLTDKIV